MVMLFERVINTVACAAPGTPIVFNTEPEDTADAAARWLLAKQERASR